MVKLPERIDDTPTEPGAEARERAREIVLNWGKESPESDWQVIGSGKDLIDRIAAALDSTPQPSDPITGLERHHAYAVQLAQHLAVTYYPQQTYVPLGTLSGVLSQIDNMIAGLPKSPQSTLQQAIDCVRELRDEWRSVLRKAVVEDPHGEPIAEGYYTEAANQILTALSSLAASPQENGGCEHCKCTCDNCAPCGLKERES